MEVLEYLKNLNKEQLEAVTHKDGPCLVAAGAGSGKTKVLTTRIIHLINEGVNSNSILAITFTNKAGEEMKKRVGNVLKNSNAFIGTFHSFGLNILRVFYKEADLDKNFTILDNEDSISVIKRVMKDLGLDIKQISPKYIKDKISFIKNEILDDDQLDEIHFDDFSSEIKKIYIEYERVLTQSNSVDFDDLLRKPLSLFYKDKEVLAFYEEKYKYILVDEYQDTNKIQYDLIKVLSNKHKNIFVVGDVNQSIYSFRGANYKNIFSFENDFKGIKIITLNKNYRSTNNILKAANEVIKNNNQISDVNLYSDLGEGDKIHYHKSRSDLDEVNFVVKKISSLLNIGYKKSDIAIFYRTNAQSRIIEEAMIKNDIAYQVWGNYYFYKRREIKNLISYLKLISNPNDDISLERVINTPKRGVGSVTIKELKEKARKENSSIMRVITSGSALEFKNIILELIKIKDNVSLTELIFEVLEKSGYLKELKSDKTLESELRIENLMEFKSITEHFQKETGTTNLEDFLESISLVSDITEYNKSSDAVTLMTIHGAKGLEFKVVFLTALEEGIFPHAISTYKMEELEEERRLCYVAITRAKEKLFISNAQKRLLFGKTLFSEESRFIKEINKSLLEKSSDILEVEKLVKEDYYDVEKNFEIGDNILHKIFGVGKVININKDMFEVKFDKKIGIKNVLKTYRGIDKI